MLDVRAGFASGPTDARVAARIAALEVENVQLKEELRIKDARMARLDPRKRPHFAGDERLAILTLRAARGWTTAETARRFMLMATVLAAALLWCVERISIGCTRFLGRKDR